MYETGNHLLVCAEYSSIEAGFSSSAHFAETNKRLFGLSASTITKDLAFYKIAEI